MIRDMTLGQYYPVDSFIHKLDPRTKLFGTMVYIISLFLADGIVGYLISAVFLAIVIRVSKVPFKFIVKGIKPILFLLLFNIPNVLVRYFGCHWGYNSGMKALNRFEELGLTEKIFTAASIIGLLVIGGMSASMVSINPVIAIGSGDSAIKLIDVINGIMPKMLSLFTTLGVYRLLKKGTKPNTILLGIIVVSVLLTAIGVF